MRGGVFVLLEILCPCPKVFTMSYAQRAMDLDKLTAPDGHVLTGVKLRSIGGHLNLEIQVFITFSFVYKST